MSFDRVLGQHTAIHLLKQALQAGRVGSGYLFHGPEGVGKELAAGAFARALLCRDGAPGGSACDACPSCIRSAAGSHPGLLLVKREPKRTQILISQVHDLASRLALRPVEGERQVVVLTEAERMNEESFNALLKTLEEPPPGATLVLVTANRETIPDTIRSRCQGVRFRPLSREIVRRIIVEKLERAPEEAELLADLSGGSMTRVARILELNLPDAKEGWSFVGQDATDDVALARSWIEMVTGGERSEYRERVETVLRVLMEAARGDLTAVPLPAGVQTRMRLLSRAIEDNRLNLSGELLFRALAVGWIDSNREGPA